MSDTRPTCAPPSFSPLERREELDTSAGGFIDEGAGGCAVCESRLLDRLLAVRAAALLEAAEVCRREEHAALAARAQAAPYSRLYARESGRAEAAAILASILVHLAHRSR